MGMHGQVARTYTQDPRPNSMAAAPRIEEAGVFTEAQCRELPGSLGNIEVSRPRKGAWENCGDWFGPII